jgi:MFS family permease
MPRSRSAGHEGRIVAVLAYAGITAAIMQTLVVPLITELPVMFDTSASTASWIITITLLTGAVATPVAGKLGDMYGKRKVLLVISLPLVIGSVVCALSTSVGAMIVGRGLQGLSIGIVPLGISLLRDVLPPARIHSSIALMSASMGVGGALGLPIAAGVAEYFDWRVLFWFAAALGALVPVLVATTIPTVAPDAQQRKGFDALGAVGLGAGLVSLLLAVSKGSTWGWGSGTIIGLFAATVVLLVAWGWWELRAPNPLVDLRVAARPQVLWTNAASILIGMGMYAMQLVVPQILQLPSETGYGLGQSMFQMGLWMAPSGLMMLLLAPVGAKVTGRFGPKVTLSIGAGLIAVGYAAGLGLLGSTWGVFVVTMVVSSGVAMAFGAMPALIMGAVPHHETGAANAFNAVMRSIGSATGSAVIGAVLAGMTTDFGGHALPSLGGFRAALAVGAGVAVVAAVIAALIPLRPAGRARVEDALPEPSELEPAQGR